jgi:mannose-6-phosphate isomerase-like protein (cupin superfamily)
MRDHPERKKTINTFKEAKKTWGSFDDFPLVAEGIDPAPHLSRSRVRQPFHLVTATDELLVTMSGVGRVEFRTPAGSRVIEVSPGDVVYLPARMPARIVPDGEIIQVRLKTAAPYQEAAAWFCDGCDELLHSVEFCTDIPQRAYWDAVVAFNANTAFRTCESCDSVADPIDLTDIVWNEVADALTK